MINNISVIIYFINIWSYEILKSLQGMALQNQ